MAKTQGANELQLTAQPTQHPTTRAAASAAIKAGSTLETEYTEETDTETGTELGTDTEIESDTDEDSEMREDSDMRGWPARQPQLPPRRPKEQFTAWQTALYMVKRVAPRQARMAELEKEEKGAQPTGVTNPTESASDAETELASDAETELASEAETELASESDVESEMPFGTTFCWDPTTRPLTSNDKETSGQEGGGDIGTQNGGGGWKGEARTVKREIEAGQKGSGDQKRLKRQRLQGNNIATHLMIANPEQAEQGMKKVKRENQGTRKRVWLAGRKRGNGGRGGKTIRTGGSTIRKGGRMIRTGGRTIRTGKTRATNRNTVSDTGQGTVWTGGGQIRGETGNDEGTRTHVPRAKGSVGGILCRVSRTQKRDRAGAPMGLCTRSSVPVWFGGKSSSRIEEGTVQIDSAKSSVGPPIFTGRMGGKSGRTIRTGGRTIRTGNTRATNRNPASDTGQRTVWTGGGGRAGRGLAYHPADGLLHFS